MSRRTNEQFFAELDRLGLAEVKARITTKVYLGADAALAQSWVDRLEVASNAEQMSLARRAIELAEETKDVARQSKILAQKANKIAIAAVVMAVISIIVSIGLQRCSTSSASQRTSIPSH